jgi:hypothetical protein
MVVQIDVFVLNSASLAGEGELAEGEVDPILYSNSLSR